MRTRFYLYKKVDVPITISSICTFIFILKYLHTIASLFNFVGARHLQSRSTLHTYYYYLPPTILYQEHQLIQFRRVIDQPHRPNTSKTLISPLNVSCPSHFQFSSLWKAKLWQSYYLCDWIHLTINLGIHISIQNTKNTFTTRYHHQNIIVPSSTFHVLLLNHNHLSLSSSQFYHGRINFPNNITDFNSSLIRPISYISSCQRKRLSSALPRQEPRRRRRVRQFPSSCRSPNFMYWPILE